MSAEDRNAFQKDQSREGLSKAYIFIWCSWCRCLWNKIIYHELLIITGESCCRWAACWVLDIDSQRCLPWHGHSLEWSVLWECEKQTDFICSGYFSLSSKYCSIPLRKGTFHRSVFQLGACDDQKMKNATGFL